MSLRFFVAGVIQGSLSDGMHDQDYRARIADIIKRHFPDATIVDPIALHPASLAYTDAEAKATFFAMIEEAKQADVVIAYVPTCSMGTAVEIWEARRAGKCVITISPLDKNWVVRHLSTHAVATLEELDALLGSASDFDKGRVLC
jgi:nucleoside 2-deoxyribosyltransferase